MLNVFSTAGRITKVKGIALGVCVFSLLACSQAIASPAGFFSFTTPFDTLSGGPSSSRDPSLASSDVAVASDGKAKAAWIENTGAGYSMKFAEQPLPGYSFDSAITVATSTKEPGKKSGFSGKTAVNQQGAIVFAWQYNQRGITQVSTEGKLDTYDVCSLYTRVRLPDGRLSPITTLSTKAGPDLSSTYACSSDSVAVGIANDGTATVAWREFTGVGTHLVPRDKIMAATYTPGGSFSTPETLSDSNIYSQNLRLAVSPSGVTAITWNQRDIPDTGSYPSEHYIKATIRSVAGTFTSPRTLETNNNACGGSAIDPVVSRSGKATFVWIYGCISSPNHSVKAISTNETGTFSTEQTLYSSSTSEFHLNDIDISDNGKIAVLAQTIDHRIVILEISPDNTSTVSPMSSEVPGDSKKIAINNDDVITIVGESQTKLFSASRKSAGSPLKIGEEYDDPDPYTRHYVGDIDAGAKDLATVLVGTYTFGTNPLRKPAAIQASSRRNATPDDCVVPTLKGKSKTSALSAITAAKCEVGDINERDPDDTPGRKKQVVVKQSVEPTTRLDGGSTIDIELAWTRY